MQDYVLKKESGFTLVEIIVSLILAGIMAAAVGMGIVSFTKGLMLAKESSHMAQKSQLAMVRLNRELMEITDIAAKNDTQPNPHIIYDNISGRQAIAKDGSIIKMFFDLPPGTTALPTTGDYTLIDNIDSFELNYYKDYQADQTWVLGTDDIEELTAIKIELHLNGVDGDFETILFPRNTR
jgi:prepilin-type N-terminal cleavage/methylation domain-containing protein